ncbi:MAG: DNA-processing protein DprA [Fusobacteria bacterium]|nr:DNA-processing protein DprA [Fusobacteriota bacterium]
MDHELDWYKIIKADLLYDSLKAIMLNFSNYKKLLSTSRVELKIQLEIPDFEIDKVFRSYELEISQEIEIFEKEKIKLLFLNGKNYPAMLKEIAKPPTLLYAKGNLEFSERSIGVIGTRKITALGVSATEKITKTLVQNDICIVSGLAKGVDTVAHETALKYGGKTIAIIGNGHDVIFPKENAKLYLEIAEKGLLLSEFPLGTEAFRWNFPMRNRIIAGLSRGVVVTESYKKGGAMITAQLAIDEGRDVFAVPGFISYPSFEGCNELIKESVAKLVSSGDDIISEYQWSKKRKKIVVTPTLFTSTESLILSILKVATSVDLIVKQSALTTQEALAILTELEINGLVKSVAGGKYMAV